MARAFLFVLDSFGIGGAADAERFGDSGSNTFAHIAEACAAGKADREGLRQGALKVPNMLALGLGRAGGAGRRLLLRPGRAAAAALFLPRRGRRSVERQGYALRALGNRGGAGAVRMGIFRADRTHLPRRADRRDHQGRQCSGHSRQLPCLGNGDHREVRRGAHQERQSRSATPRRIRSSRSPRMRAISGSNASTNFARWCGSWSTRSISGG